ncbi:MAG: hypothetical protein GY796_17475 [Chloroflexi bacterium]|nr:hypothetical protein [Chloroflexota bacterium]
MRLLLFTFGFVTLFALVSLAQATAAPYAPHAGPTIRVSVKSDGSQSNDDSNLSDISADGRTITFISLADNIVSGDTNDQQDIFVHDTQTGVTERVTDHANGPSYDPKISDDGRYVVFASRASNLVADDNNGKQDIFIYDRSGQTMQLVSVVVNGGADNDSRHPDISGNGRYIVFSSSATNLVGEDNNLRDDVFRWDQQAKVMERISVDSNEAEGNGHSHSPAISSDGSRIVFVSIAANLVSGDSNNLPDIFLREINDDDTFRLSQSGATEANGDNLDPAISNNGDYVVFVSFSNNLVINDTNGYPDIYLRDLTDASMARISITSANAQPDDWCEEPAISGDGRYVVFQSYASTLLSDNVSGSRDVFILDRQDHSFTRASIASSGVVGNASSKEPVIAADGRYIAYSSKADNLILIDTNGKRDIFVHDMKTSLPPPTLNINHSTAAPGSLLAFDGQYWEIDSTISVYVNDVLVGTTTADNANNMAFRLESFAATQEGGYLVRVTQDSTELYAYFRLLNDAPLWSGSGSTFPIPNGIAQTHFQFLPALMGEEDEDD